jgi:hypothetical protein
MISLSKIYFIFLNFFLLSCVVDKTKQKFTFPNNLLSTSSNNISNDNNSTNDGDSGNDNTNNNDTSNNNEKISIISTEIYYLSNQSSIPGPIGFDGTRLIMWIPSSTSGSICNPSDTTTFQYFSLDFSSQIESTSVILGISSNQNCNGEAYQVFGTTAGFSGLLWNKNSGGSNRALSERDNSNGELVTTIDINPAVYGCRANEFKMTYCEGFYYGACSNLESNVKTRLFKTDINGVMQLALTTTLDNINYGPVEALTCFKDSIVFVTRRNIKNAYNGFFQFDLDLNFIKEDIANSYDFPDGLRSIKGITTDGNYFYLQGARNTKVNPATVTFGKATLGGFR